MAIDVKVSFLYYGYASLDYSFLLLTEPKLTMCIETPMMLTIIVSRFSCEVLLVYISHAFKTLLLSWSCLGIRSLLFKLIFDNCYGS